MRKTTDLVVPEDLRKGQGKVIEICLVLSMLCLPCLDESQEGTWKL